MLAHMPAFATTLTRLVEHTQRYDAIHANFFMSGLVERRAAPAKEAEEADRTSSNRGEAPLRLPGIASGP